MAHIIFISIFFFFSFLINSMTMTTRPPLPQPLYLFAQFIAGLFPIYFYIHFSKVESITLAVNVQQTLTNTDRGIERDREG